MAPYLCGSKNGQYRVQAHTKGDAKRGRQKKVVSPAFRKRDFDTVVIHDVTAFLRALAVFHKDVDVFCIAFP